MKKVSTILNHLKQNPEFRKINTNEAIQRLINVLPMKLKKGIKFGYVKNDTLYFVLTHPVYKMEFEYNKALINSLLSSAHMTSIKDVKFFVTNKREKKQEEIIFYEKYDERSYGIFKNSLKDPKLHKIFEEIREIIKSS
ncbi:hypothetical protein CP960_08470 [Malaciobacter halophilus]|uniref:DUF721 domain-containing protein n=1 Tax=Malaciobacter halophilus TaxID=197482 RepID=A0A2N1J241_9BACT|nr:hypothetical protein [Malaciobacter halophilus]AXH10089.1 DUF721 domain-containing protein [Malaciobacter halophilus]PKI80574.1 hypothetical protein CP960_08470 [Malaciobacter halophilus]